MIFVPDQPTEIEIEGVKFRVRLLSGEDVLEVLGKKGISSVGAMDGATAAEIVRKSVIDFTVNGTKYGPESVKKLAPNIYTQLLTKILELNFEVKPENFQQMSAPST